MYGITRAAEAAGNKALQRAKGRCECVEPTCPVAAHGKKHERCSARLADLVSPVERRIVRIDKTVAVGDPAGWLFLCEPCIDFRNQAS